MSVYSRSFIKINKAPIKFNEALTKPNHGKLISDIILIIIVNKNYKKKIGVLIYILNFILFNIYLICLPLMSSTKSGTSARVR